MPRHYKDKLNDSFQKINDSKTAVRTLKGILRNSFDAIKTSVTTNAGLVSIPDTAKDGIILMHVTAGQNVWIGKDNTITAAGTNVFPLPPNVPIELDIKKGSEIYAIAGTTVPLYCGAIIKE